MNKDKKQSDDFNLLEDLVDNAKYYDANSKNSLRNDNTRIFLIGKQGDMLLTEQPKRYYVAGNNTKAEVLILYGTVLEWKMVKFSNKGFFINTRFGRIYIDDFKAN